MKENNLTIFSLLARLFFKLNNRRRNQIYFLFLLIFGSAFIELFNLSLAFPFLEIISKSENIGNFKNLRSFFGIFGFMEGQDLILPMVITFSFTALCAAIIKNCNLWYGARLAASIGSDLSCDCFRKNICQDYEQFIQNNSSELIANNTVFVNQVTDTLQISARFFTALIISAFISTYLLFFNFFYSSLAIVIFLFVYLIIAKLSKRSLKKNSLIIANNTRSQVQLIQETSGFIRDILLSSNQEEYLKIYKKIDFNKRISEAKNLFINLFPRNTIESILLIFIASTSYYISKTSSLEIIIPTIGTFAIGAQKLLPYMQQTYGSWSSLIGSSESIVKVFQMLEIPTNKFTFNYQNQKLPIKRDLIANNLSLRYKGSKSFVFRRISFKISAGDIVGIVGETGSGKSTLADLLMGLLNPTEGTLEVDGLNIFDRNNLIHLISWRKTISHVPQNIYLVDSTIAVNIAFDSNRKVLNLSKVKEAARRANIHKFINELPEGYSTLVGENGIKLSGGQRQRIGIARALYKESSVLVFDEATSALDINTEDKILETIYGLKGSKTIFIISHRPNTLKRCDKLVKFLNGKVILDIN